jgi:serine protease Do
MHALASRTQTARIAIVASLALLAALPASAEKLWTEGRNGGVKVEIPSLGPLVDKVDDAVLTISTEANLGAPGADDPRMEMFKRFGFELPRNMPQRGQGTGFLIHRAGYALTNHHVVEGAETIEVRVGSGSKVYQAEVIGSDAKTDVALIKLKGRRDFPVLPLGDSDKLSVGDFVVAIGNPFGLSQSVSLGILSANHRREINPSGRQGLYDFLQTDASINPGNSGGPLMNLRGEVIGINTAINAAGQGLGFAIPINLVKKLIPDLRAKGKVSRSWIGVSIRKVSADLAEGFGLDRPRGALVAQVVEGGPADKAGLEPGDVIVRFDGKNVEDANQLPLLAGFAGVGKKVRLSVMRDGKPRKFSLKLGELPEDLSASARTPRKGEAPETGKLGLAIDDLDGETRGRLGLSARARGAHVVQVLPGSPAFEAGLRKDDVILEVNGRLVKSAKGFIDQVGRAKSGRVLKLLFLRDGDEVFTAFRKP